MLSSAIKTNSLHKRPSQLAERHDIVHRGNKTPVDMFLLLNNAGISALSEASVVTELGQAPVVAKQSSFVI